MVNKGRKSAQIGPESHFRSKVMITIVLEIKFTIYKWNLTTKTVGFCHFPNGYNNKVSSYSKFLLKSSMIIERNLMLFMRVNLSLLQKEL